MSEYCKKFSKNYHYPIQKKFASAAEVKQARAEREKIRHEKEILLALSDKELMVEAIMLLRGYNERITDIEAEQADLDSRMDSAEADVRALEFKNSDQ